MSWIIELLLELLVSASKSKDNDRSIVGKSRLDEEAERFWKWFAVACVIGIIVFIVWVKIGG